ncbi:MAG: cytochrome C [Candidatus Thiodiazotropha sp. (ex Dulcina madagascariensis)]|nr:cytochrome C [Candidatus Thiodiazotropha sp. (ex Dulcina madagascariensis)]
MLKNALSLGWTSKAVAAISMLMLASAFPAVAGIRGSPHDFSRTTWSGEEICNVCHTPHNADSSSQVPLWNHEVSIETYKLYSSPTMNVVAEQSQPGGVSRMCLSCHDGTIAIDSYGGNSGKTTITGKPNLGTDLSNDHPVGIEWVHQTQSAGSLSCLSCHVLDYNPETMAYEFVGSAGGELRFFDRKVECPSCHDVHNNQVMDVKLLRKSLAGSQLCLHCHPK